MLHNVSKLYCDVFEQYLNCFLDVSKSDPLPRLEVVRANPAYSHCSKYLFNQVPTAGIPADLCFIEYIVFRDFEVIARVGRAGPPYLTAANLFILSIYARMEHSAADEPGENDNEPFDPNYVNQLSPASVKHRAGHLLVDGVMQHCSIASTRLGRNSPYVALFVTKDAYARDRRDIIMNVLALIALAMQSAIKSVPARPPIRVAGFVRLTILNRTNGAFWEDFPLVNQKSRQLADVLFERLSEKVMDVVAGGYTVYMLDDGLFRLSYQLVIVDETGAVVTPEVPVLAKPFDGDVALSYAQAGAELCPRSGNVSVYELLSIWISEVDPREIVRSNLEKLIAFLDLPKAPAKAQRASG
jgi:hypothetical protein